jgi:predicted nucleic acid-binding protein
MIVLDASVALELVLQTSRSRAITARVGGATETLHAPHLIDLEVVQVLRRFTRTHTLTDGRAASALEDFRDLPIVRYPHVLLLDRVWDLRRNATAYDGAYLALAEALDAPLLTVDQRLRAVPGSRARVELV